MKLFEIFDKKDTVNNSDVVWRSEQKPTGAIVLIGEFTINKHKYFITITRKNTLAEIGFKDDDMGVSMTNRGNSLQVFKKIFDIVCEYIQNKNPPRLQCAAATPELEKTYAKMMPMLARKFTDRYNFNSSDTDTSGKTIYKLEPKSFKVNK